MNITSAQYEVDPFGNNSGITAVIDGVEMFVPVDSANRHYAIIMEQVGAETLTIVEAAPAPEPTAEQLQAEADKVSARSKLEALGLTEAEINALIGN